MRLYVIPILKDRWAYYCHSTLPTTSRLTKIVDWSSQKWENLDKAEPDSWKKKLYVKGTNVMNQLDYQEWFLKSIPAKEELQQPLNEVLVHHPSLLDPSLIHQHLEALLQYRIPYHRKYMWYSAYWVPIACTFVLVPLIPNIPLAYNLFRLYSHYKALKGAEHLQHLMSSTPTAVDSSSGEKERENEAKSSIHRSIFKYTQDMELDTLFNGARLSLKLNVAKNIAFPKELEQAYQPSSEKKRNAVPSHQQLASSLAQDIDGVLNQQHIKYLVDQLDVPGLETELSRARFQILKNIATERFANNK
ncbi:mitochondrial K+-H+ exchange-related-domain-containing protein [Mycotypha africana]|uniref:mitochondrial K+-H+ exchange-related-domain-containing protein n=1 Tax=Mycotypha africana TaxID=64632 RepID=UPI002300CF38|nr:mitochondrial K+-H+ exchange-related-domain-containing protein [Mycotypha africana]KAI8973384.1 mitochondrial K+-H+ exchange-related-domain-containing protein [Mycotypha africana]